MKKYYQAALTLTAALSLIALLFYRHEYNKLRFVLQVFNYFGTPIQKGDYNCTGALGTTSINYYTEFNSPESTWQRISEDLYIYSAYNKDNKEIQAIGFGKNIDNLKYSCHIFFDNYPGSVQGEFSYKIMSDVTVDESFGDAQNKFNSYLLICKFTKINKKFIVGVRFKNTAQKNFDIFPITHVRSLNNNNSNVNSNDNIICVAPSTEGFMNHANMISFLAFHYHLGWKNFIVYDFGISHILSNNLKQMARISDAQWNFTYTTVPWNFPYAQISHNTIRKIIETDCIYRGYNKATMAVTLSWNEYINLRYHNSVENVLTDIVNENGKLVFDKYLLDTLVYCLNQSDDNASNSITPMLTTMTRLRKVIHNDPHYIYGLANILSSNVEQKNVGDLMYINRYQKCNINDRRLIVESDMLKFVEYIPSTKIFQYFITGQLLNN